MLRISTEYVNRPAAEAALQRYLDRDTLFGGHGIRPNEAGQKNAHHNRNY